MNVETVSGSKLARDAAAATDLPHAATWGQAAFDRMIALGVAPTPQNYQIWFAYFRGDRPDLVNRVDRAVAGGEFNAAFAEALHRQYFADDVALSRVREATSQIESKVGEVMALVGSAGRSTREFGEALSGASDSLDRNEDGGKLREVVSELIVNTRQMLDRSRTLEHQLAQSNSQISELRDDLATVREEVMTDPLTGVPNRRHFDVALNDLARQAERDGMSLCLCMVDIDHFKRFNDTYGHQMGDEVLKLVARTLRNGIKERDIAARFGGEEFAIILPEVTLAQAGAVCERIRQSVASRKLVRRATGENMGEIHMSVGVAWRRPHEDTSTLIERADEALYLAKRSGRNRVCDETMLDAPIAAIG